MLDVCVDYVGRDGTLDMDEIASRFATQVTVPLVLDSTEPQVIEAGLQRLGGRAILNSANLEDGEAEGSRFDRVCSLAREYRPRSCACSSTRRARPATSSGSCGSPIASTTWPPALRAGARRPHLRRPHVPAVDRRRGPAPRRHGPIEAIRRIKAELPGVYTTLGISNVSFGLSPAARHVLNSVFLHECVEAGLDSAIVHDPHHAAQQDPRQQLKVCSTWSTTAATRPRATTRWPPCSTCSRTSRWPRPKEDRSGWPVDERLKARIIDGDLRTG